MEKRKRPCIGRHGTKPYKGEDTANKTRDTHSSRRGIIELAQVGQLLSLAGDRECVFMKAE